MLFKKFNIDKLYLICYSTARGKIMQEKCLVGFVIYNKNNQFLFTRTVKNNVIDLGLVGDVITGNITNEKLCNIIKKNLCLNISIKSFNKLFEGTDLDGKHIIYSIQIDKSAKSMLSVIDNKTEFLWLSYSQINKLYNEKRINTDQLYCIEKCHEQIRKETSLIKERIKKIKTTTEKSPLIYSNPNDEYTKYVEKHTDRRILARIINGRKIKPCGKECREQGYLIAQIWHHSSFENFPELMDDEEFILSAAEITPNPVECGNYFYMYINDYLKAKPDFRLNFLKQVYLNLNVNSLEDINLIVQELNLTKENKIILNDLEFKHIIEKKFNNVLKKLELKYHCSGSNKKELHKYKVTANDIKIQLENIKKGLTDIVNSFNVGEKIDEPEFAPSTFYEFLCEQAIKPVKEKSTENTSKPKQEKVEVDNYEPTNYYEFMLKQNRTKNL